MREKHQHSRETDAASRILGYTSLIEQPCEELSAFSDHTVVDRGYLRLYTSHIYSPLHSSRDQQFA